MSTSNIPPADGPSPRSRGWRLIRGLFRWAEQLYRWDERPTAAAFREACEDRDKAQAEVRRLKVALASAQADADAASAEVDKLAAVCARDLERVMAEAAFEAAKREKALADVATSKTNARRE